MEVLSNVFLPLVLECPATPCASSLLLSVLFLAFLVFNLMAHLPFRILTI